jgi:2'-5' RNA ligase
VLHVPVRVLEALASVVARALAVVGDAPAEGESAGANLDARPFAGHVTLARVRGDKSGPGRLAGVPVHASWDVDSLSLMGSKLGPGGARYETIGTVELLA